MGKEFSTTARSWLIIALFILLLTIVSTVVDPRTNAPFGTGLGLDLFIIAVTSLLFVHSTRTEGLETTLSLFFTAFIFFGCGEVVWVFMGTTGILPQTYTYNIGFLRFLGIPFLIGLSWFIWVYAAYKLVIRGFPNGSAWFKALLAGLLGLAIDLCTDPATVNIQKAIGGSGYWDWSVQGTQTIFTVPLYNFWGWLVGMFLVIFVYQRFWMIRKAVDNYLLALCITFVLSLVLIKGPRILADSLFGEHHILPIPFEEGGSLSFDKAALFIMLSAGIIGLFVAAIARKRLVDLLFFGGIMGSLGYNLVLTFTIQSAFPETWLVYLFFPPMVFILALCWRYAISSPKLQG